MLQQFRSVLRQSFVRRAFSSYPSHEVVGLPALSPTMTHGNLASWKMKEGDTIEAGDVICEIETDKAVVDFEAQDQAFLAKILIPEGTTDVAVGQPIMVLVEEKEDVAAFAAFEAPAVEPVAPAPEAIPPSKDQVPKADGQPVAPVDFLVKSQTVQVPPPAPKIPEPLSVSTKVKESQPQPPPSRVDNGILMESLMKKQQDYLKRYGLTGVHAI